MPEDFMKEDPAGPVQQDGGSRVRLHEGRLAQGQNHVDDFLERLANLLFGRQSRPRIALLKMKLWLKSIPSSAFVLGGDHDAQALGAGFELAPFARHHVAIFGSRHDGNGRVVDQGILQGESRDIANALRPHPAVQCQPCVRLGVAVRLLAGEIMCLTLFQNKGPVICQLASAQLCDFGKYRP